MSLPMIRFETYRATPGLERYEPLERFRVYLQTHRRLLSTDPEYRRMRREYFLTFIPVALVPGAAWAAVALLGPIVAMVLTVFSTVALLIIAFRHQQRMNQRIGTELIRGNDSRSRR